MSILTKGGEIDDAYRSFISKSRYSRWIEEENRRETWEETVDRYFDFMKNHMKTNYPNVISDYTWGELRNAVLNHEIMPSMRGLMTAGPALERENLAQFNCFAGSTKVITKEYGPVTLSEVSGEKVTAWTPEGWKPSEAMYFGEQETQRIVFKPHFDRTNHRLIVDATPDHRWILEDGTETTTLNVGDRIRSNAVVTDRTPEYDEGVRHGIIFGDGTHCAQWQNGRHQHQVLIAGQHSDEMLGYFERYSYNPSRNGLATAYHVSIDNMKEFPVAKSTDYVAGFIYGWLLADGNQIHSESPKLDSQKPGAYEWLVENAPMAGYVVVGINYNDKPTNYGERANPLARITLKESKTFTVESILELDVQDVYCLVVPETGNFTLANGLLTGNCSFIAIDDVRAFDEALYVLMNGVGLGFSVEAEYVSKLPVVNEHFENTRSVINVADSKAGWARAFRELIAMLYAGQVPVVDVSNVRPAGARLKTFGGRASGPQPLVDLFDFTIGVFKNAAGRKLTPIECHDIMCKVGDVVVVGGVRRSALISLSDLSDYEMSKAKSGAWWESTGYRRLANNSAVYYKKPSIGEFLGEWGSLYESKSGERGIVNLGGMRHSPLAPRRDLSKIQGLNPCGEILLRSKQLCNLTEIIVKPTDTVDDLIVKAQYAAILGTIQSSLTNFKYLRKVWRDNCDEERLLGVSLTGQLGHTLLNGSEGFDKLGETLDAMREATIDVNALVADGMGINRSTAITTVKPSGTVSQLTASSSGMHPWHNSYYIRSVRADNKDPLTEFMRDAGIPNEPDVMSPDTTTVFYFPQAAPEGSLTRNELSAIEHLEIWKAYKVHWTEHNPSVTVNVREEEWIEVANWVYENWDVVGGISFLPYDGGTYKQAPYQDCTEADFWLAKANMPEALDWSLLSAYETEDTTTGSQTLSCTAGNCEVVDIRA